MKYRTLLPLLRASVVIGVVLAMLFPPQAPASALPVLTVTPITWNVIGLDSNNVNVGPDHFPVGVRVCNTGDALATNVAAAFFWDSSNTYINIRPLTNSTLTLSGLAPGSCTDFYFEVKVTRSASAYDTARRYHINVTADGGISVSTPTPRELFVEHLVSQSRNAVTDVKLDGVSIPAGGTMSLVVGNTYTIELIGYTATNGYNQLESFINFPNTIFQILTVASTYTAGTSPTDKLYADACGWDNNPSSPTYRSCIVSDNKSGGNITVTYQVKILSVPSTNPEPLSTLIYDFSGSSYHYNSDFSVSSRSAYVIDPTTAVSISKAFAPGSTVAGGSSTLTFTLSNSAPVTISGANFSDNLPLLSGGQMVVATPATYSTAGCGTPTFAPVAGAASISFSNGTIAPNGTCTVSVNVSVPSAPTSGAYANTSNDLFINTTDTGHNATANLALTTTSAGSGLCSLTLAQWTFAGFTANPPPQPSPSTQASDVSTAAVSVGNGLVDEADSSAGGGNPQPGVLTYGWPKTGPIDTATFAYVQFAIDTSGYSQVDMQFDAQRKANGPNNDAVYFSTDGTTWTLKNTFNSTTAWATYGPYSFTGQTSTTGVTYFRIYGYGANATSRGNDMNLDNVTFTGCGTPQQPTLSKAFSPNPILVGGTSTLTFTLTNPNAAQLTGATFTDSLPSGLQVAATPAASTTCTGSPTWAPAAGATALTFGSPTGANIPASGSCTAQVNVTATTAGPHTNVSGFISTTEGGTNSGTGGSASASLTALLPPQITKLFDPDPILPNGTTTLALVITNPNPSDALPAVAFSDTFPVSPGAMTVAATPNASTSGCGSPTYAPVAGAGSISFSDGTIAAGGTCTVKVDVTASTVGTYNNTSGAVTTTIAGVTTGTSTASASLTVKSPAPGITLSKQVSTGPTGPWSNFVAAPSGGNVYYRFMVENTGDVPFNPFSVSDPTLAGSGADPASCSWTTTNSPSTLPALPVASSTIDPSATCVMGPLTAASGSHANTATAHGTYSSIVYNSSPSTATYATTGLTLAKNVTEAYFVTAGDILHYSYLVTNSGFAPLAGPVGVSDDKSTDEACPDVNTVGDLDSFLDPGESLTCTSTYTVTAGDVTAGSVTNLASATAGGVTSNTDTKTVSLAPDLTAVKANDVGGSVSLGGSFTWNVQVSNAAGVATATFNSGETILTDNLPSGPAYGSVTITNGATPPGGTGSVSCLIVANTLTCSASGGSVTLPAGASFSAAFGVTPASTGSLANPDSGIGGMCAVDPNNVVTEHNEADNSCADTVAVLFGAPSISKNFSPDPIFVNGTSTLTFTITNPNTATALTGVGFTDSLPAGLQVAATPNASTSSDCGAPTFSPAPGNTSLTFSGGTIPASGTCTVSVAVTATTSGLKNNTSGNVTSSNGGTGNTASDTLTVTSPSADLSLNKTVDNATPVVGTNVVFTITVANGGPNDATNVAVSDVLPAGWTYVSSTPSQGIYNSGTGVWTVGMINNGANATLDIVATVSNAGAKDNYAQVSASDQTDPNSTPGDNSTSEDDDDTVTVTPRAANPAYAITKTITSTGPYDSAGDVITYQVVVTNTGNVTLTGVSVSDSLLTNLDCDVGTPGNQTSGLTVNVGSSLTCAGSYTLTQSDLDTNGGGDGDIDNTVSVTSTQIPAPQTSSAAAPLTHPAGFFDPPFGQKVLNAELLPELEWKMVWINNSNSAAINVQITDPIPAGTTYVLNSLSCVANNASSTTSCLYDSVQNRIFWQGVIAPDPGASDELSANNEVVITFRVTVPDTLNQVDNQGSSLTDTNGDSLFTDEPTDPSSVSVSVSNIATWTRGTGGGGGGSGGPFTALPGTGFAPGEFTELPVQPSDQAYSDTDIWLEIPSLGLRTTIVGVPNAEGSWDVSWLWDQAGWLQGTAFPTWNGNSVLTGHVYLSDGEPGPFVDLHKLGWGDRVIIHAYGSKYVYEVRENLVVQPGDPSVLRHEQDPWITLLTCQAYNEATNSYAHRLAVRAVLIKVTEDFNTAAGNKR